MVMSKDVLSRLDVSTKQQRIARIARQKSEEPLTLLNHYMDESWLMAAYDELKERKRAGNRRTDREGSAQIVIHKIQHHYHTNDFREKCI